MGATRCHHRIEFGPTIGFLTNTIDTRVLFKQIFNDNLSFAHDTERVSLATANGSSNLLPSNRIQKVGTGLPQYQIIICLLSCSQLRMGVTPCREQFEFKQTKYTHQSIKSRLLGISLGEQRWQIRASRMTKVQATLGWKPMGLQNNLFTDHAQTWHTDLLIRNNITYFSGPATN